MPTITTVRGEIRPDELGMTSMHEHLNTDVSLLRIAAQQFGAPAPPESRLTLRNENMAFLRSGAAIFSEESMTLADVDYTSTELGYFRAIGGRAIVDASPVGLRGDVTQLRESSERSGVHVVCATGLYTAAMRPATYQGWTEDQQMDLFHRELTEGIDGSGVRAGILKCALSTASPDNPLLEVELVTLRACARVAAETGVSMHVHTAFPMGGNQVIAGVELVLDEVGLAPDRLVMMHMDSFLRPWDSRAAYLDSIDSVKSVSTDLLERVLDRGVTIGFDSWGTEVDLLPQDDDRLKGLIHLLRKGFTGQIILGHDVTQKPQGVSYGAHGFTWFTKLIPGVFAQLGLPEDTFRRLTVDNPARVLAH
jgi:phosphotriesterase-related protein